MLSSAETAIGKQAKITLDGRLGAKQAEEHKEQKCNKEEYLASVDTFI